MKKDPFTRPAAATQNLILANKFQSNYCRARLVGGKEEHSQINNIDGDNSGDLFPIACQTTHGVHASRTDSDRHSR